MLTRIREWIKRYFSMLHAPVHRLTSSRVVGSFRRIPMLLLTTTGRKNGKARIWPLLYFHVDGNYMLIASNWGQHYHAALLLNLRAHPTVHLTIGRRELRASARESTDDERERLWRIAADVYPGYERYQQRTDRTIPVVVLEP